MNIKNCVICDKKFESISRQTCSKECHNRLCYLKRLDKLNEKYSGVKLCKQCNKEFKISGINFKSLFCSNDCKKIFNGKKCKICNIYLSSEHKSYLCNKCNKINCIICNKEITTTITDINKRHNQTCSKECFKKHRSNIATQQWKNEDSLYKLKETCKINTSWKTDVVKKKSKQTKLERYGNENYNNIDQIKETFIKRHIDKNIPTEYKELLNELCFNKEKLKSWLKSIPFSDRTYVNFKLKFKTKSLNNAIIRFNLDDLINKFSSSHELELQDFLKENKINYQTHNRTVLNGKELDIYIPDYGLAIEVNGAYWHSNLIQDKNYHFNKSKLCEEKGIRLIHIWEYEWNNERQKPILESIIKSALGINKNKIFARKCKIEIRESKSMKDFFNQNNIQGFRGGKFSICLIYNEEIVMAYQMGKCFFGKGKYEWEVIRGATKLGYTVVGGASKIWKYFIKNYNPINCVYYIDYNYFNGNSILNLDSNFKFLKVQPSFKNWWVKENIAKNREPMRHKEIKDAYENNECYQIWNAGTKVYLWENKNLIADSGLI